MQLKLADLIESKPTKVQIDGVDVCVAKIGNEVFAINDTCSHSDASLSEGEIHDGKIECWLHGAEFDLRTGQAVTPPAVAPVEVYKVEYQGEMVSISKGDA
jgi:3-phenylpropionate/trans-cinnamate dioxygenase ferredoxin subunit